MDYLIVGAGFAGACSARTLADGGKRCLVIDRRPHIAGNAYDHLDAQGVRVHAYGPHIFHTNSEAVFEWLSRFTDWRPYAHRVRAKVGAHELPIPINRTTLNTLYGLNLDEAGAAAFLAAAREPREPLRTSEDVVLASVGRDLCDKFFAGYTRKQWGLELHELAAGVAARIPTRTNDDDRYFGDRFQAMPQQGYTALFERMLDHPLIEVRTGLAYEDVGAQIDRAATLFTGPIDSYYGHRFGRLPYRSLRFAHEHRAHVGLVQAVGTINYPNDHAYTRCTEFRHLTGQAHTGTSLVREYPEPHTEANEPYYPIPNPANEALYQRYAELASAEQGVHFIGRLAQYRYYNMDQVCAAALTLARRLLAPALAA